MQAALHVVRAGARASVEMFIAKYPPKVLVASHIPRVIFQTLFFVLLVRFALGPDLVHFALVGNAVGMAAIVAIVQAGGIVSEDRGSGYLPYLMAVPADRVWIILGRCTAFYADALLSAVLALFVVGLIVGAVPDPARVLYAFPALLLITATLTSMGLLVGSLAFHTRFSQSVTNFTYYMLLLLCGANYPLDRLPQTAQAVARLLPMTHGLQALRGLLEAASYVDVLRPLATEVVIGLAYAVVAYVVWQRQIERARRTGGTEFF